MITLSEDRELYEQFAVTVFQKDDMSVKAMTDIGFVAALIKAGIVIPNSEKEKKE